MPLRLMYPEGTVTAPESSTAQFRTVSSPLLTPICAVRNVPCGRTGAAAAIVAAVRKPLSSMSCRWIAPVEESMANDTTLALCAPAGFAWATATSMVFRSETGTLVIENVPTLTTGESLAPLYWLSSCGPADDALNTRRFRPSSLPLVATTKRLLFSAAIATPLIGDVSRHTLPVTCSPLASERLASVTLKPAVPVTAAVTKSPWAGPSLVYSSSSSRSITTCVAELPASVPSSAMLPGVAVSGRATATAESCSDGVVHPYPQRAVQNASAAPANGSLSCF
jgi:hypothetical protein